MAKQWRINPHDAEMVERLEQTAKVPPVVAQLLVGRGIYDAERARDFIDAKLTGLRQPNELPGVEAAVELIFETIQAEKRIVIYGDYDADGMTSTAILYRCLNLLNANVAYFIPNRLDDGYGLNDEAVRKIASRGTALVITVDCGIGSVQQARLAKELGMKLIVTDHHEFADELPDASVLVHPRLPGHSYPFGGLCGAGVALKLAWALCQQASGGDKVTEAMRNFLMMSVGISAIGTVCDVVPLVDENRLIVRHGLKSLFSNPPLGIDYLKKITKLHEKPELASEDIGFMLGPRLNAAGRLGQATLGVELLTTESHERAEALAEYIHELNSSRDSLERSIYLAANKQAQEEFDPVGDPALVLSGIGWHAGVIGIVAGRLAEKFNRPVVLISLDQLDVKPGMGSARSACGLNLHRAFAACSHHLVSHGGHAAAAGLKIEAKNIDQFRAEFNEHVAGEVTESDRVAELRIDAEAPLTQMTFRTVKQIEQLAPFGQHNPRPILCTTGVELAEPPKKMGGGERHLSVKLKQFSITMRGVAFGQGEWADELEGVEGPIDIAYQPVINTYRGRNNVELHLKDWRVSVPSKSSV